MGTPIETKIAIGILTDIAKDLFQIIKEKVEVSYSRFQNRQTIKNLEKNIRNYAKVKTLWQRDKDVLLNEFYYPSTIKFSHPHKHSVVIESLNDLPKEQSFVIEGIVGQGKSIFLRYLCIQELGEKSSRRIPILIELRKLDSSYAIQDAVFQTIQNLGLEINDALFEIYAKSGKFIFLFDGFDELDESLIRKTTNTIENWIELYPKCQMIISSRPNSDIMHSRFFQVVRLAPLSNKDFQPFLKKIGVQEPILSSLLDAIEKSPSEISGLLISPLLLTLLVIVYQCEQSIPNDLPEFFERLFSTVFSRHDNTKPGFRRRHLSGLSESKLERLFEAFCFSVLKYNFNPALSKDQFSTAFAYSMQFNENKCQEDDFKHDVTKIACLMQEDGATIEFIHKSILDYFAASFIKHCTEGQAKAFYLQFVDSHQIFFQWRQALQFLSQIDEYRFCKFYKIPALENFLAENNLNDVSLTETKTTELFMDAFKDADLTILIKQSSPILNRFSYSNSIPELLHTKYTLGHIAFNLAQQSFKNFPIKDCLQYGTTWQKYKQDNDIYRVQFSKINSTLDQSTKTRIHNFYLKLYEEYLASKELAKKEELKKNFIICDIPTC